jgi:hypothetical protein
MNKEEISNIIYKEKCDGNIFGLIFGHSFKCCMGFESICSRCGRTYTELYQECKARNKI